MPGDTNPKPQQNSTSNGDPAPDVDLTSDQTVQPTDRTEEWGDRVDTGRQIARGGHDGGTVPGATGSGSDPRAGKGQTGHE